MPTSRSTSSPSWSTRAEWVIAQFMRASPKATIECMRAIARGDFRADMRAVTVPTLLVHAEDDPMVPAQTVRAWLGRAPPAIEQVWTRSGGHVGWVADLSESIPEDAHLTAIRARDDSLIVDGLAAHAARVFDALEKTRGLVDVKAASPVRRERQEGGGTLDHFLIGARVVKSVAPGPTTTTASVKAKAGQ